ncbi:hypothetical protein DV736_g2385, partial [Chaetothyriales sp. CBS 134916]
MAEESKEALIPRDQIDGILPDAEEAISREHELTFLEAIKLYPKAVGWSALMSAALIMDGYDLKLISSLFAQPVFQKAFGHAQSRHTYQITAAWQAGLTNGSNLGQMVGLMIGGTIVEKFGFRRTMMIALLIVPVIVFVQFFASSLPMLETGQILLESPWWLVRQNRLEDAKASVLRLTSRQNVHFDADNSVALMVLTTERERELNASTEFIACFRGSNLRRTAIVIACYCMQVLSGSSLRSYATYFFQQAGLPTDQAFNMSILAYQLGTVGVLTAWLLMANVGRRTLFLWGLASLAIIYVVVGALGISQASSPSSERAWTIGGLLLMSFYLSNATIGPASYALVSELPSALLRNKSVVIARLCYAVVNTVAYTITPYQLSPSNWNWGAKSGFFWAGQNGG